MIPSIEELISRPIINPDAGTEMFTKMTVEEIAEWEGNAIARIKSRNNNDIILSVAELLSARIDADIIYKLFKLEK